MRRKESGEAMEAAMDYVVPHMANVSVLYVTRMGQNRKATGSLLDEQMRGEYEYCRGLNDRLTSALQD